MSDELSRVLIKKTGERYLVHRKARESYFVREMITNRFKKSCKEKRHKKKKKIVEKRNLLSYKLTEWRKTECSKYEDRYSLQIFGKKKYGDLRKEEMDNKIRQQERGCILYDIKKKISAYSIFCVSTICNTIKRCEKNEEQYFCGYI